MTSTGQRRVDVESLRARARRPVLREAISDRNPCPNPRGRCPCRTLRGNLHCPLPDHPDRNPSCSVTDGRPALWHCHACDVGGDLVTLLERADGLNRGEALDVAARMVGAERNERPYRLPKRRPRRERVEEPPPWLNQPEPEPSPTTRTQTEGQAHHLVLWSAATAVGDTPVSSYLEGRYVWPPEAPAPASGLVRWVTTKRWKRLVPPPWQAGPPCPPDGCAGALLWPLWDHGRLIGIGAEGLDTAGRRTGPDPRAGCDLGRWRRTVGEGGVWGADIRDSGPALVLEGPLDGLTAVRVAMVGVDRVLARSQPLWNQAHTSGWLDTVLRVAEAGLVIAAGGTARLVEAALAAAERRDQVVIVADADRPGASAATDAARTVREAGQAKVEMLRPWSQPDTPEDLTAAAERWPWLTAKTNENDPEVPE